MRPALALGLARLVWSGTASADTTPTALPRIDMRDLCTQVVSGNSVAPLDGFDAADPLVNVNGVKEHAVRHPTAPVVASTVYDGTDWFLCLVAGHPVIKAEENLDLVAALIHDLDRQIRETKAHAVPLQGVFGPARVICGASGKLTATQVVVGHEGALRIVIANDLPAGVRTPCANLAP